MATPTLTTTNFTRINNADANTSWSNLSGGGSPNVNNDVFVQGTGSIGRRVDNGTAGYAYDLGTANVLDWTPGGADEGDHVFYWINILQPDLINSAVFRITEDAAKPNPGDSLDYEVFPLNPYSGGWYRAVIDPRVPFSTDNGSGTRDVKMSAVRWFGFFFDMGNVGGTAPNCMVDAIDVGRGLIVTGGSTTDKITWSDIATLASNNTNAFGLIEEKDGIFFMRGEWQFGDATNDCYFEDTDTVCIWENTIAQNDDTTPVIYSAIAPDLNRLVLVEGTGTTDFINGVKVGTGNDAVGSNGCIYQASPPLSGIENNLTIDFSDPDITNVELFGCTFRRCLTDQLTEESIVFSSDVTNGPNHEVSGCTFDQCGTVDLGRVSAQNLVFSATVQAGDALPFESVQHWDDSTSTWDDGTASTNDREGDSWTPVTGAAVNNDELYFGLRDRFTELLVVSENTAFVAAANTHWEYYDGTGWTEMDTTLDDDFIAWGSIGTSEASIGQPGRFTWAMPTDWEQTTVNSVGPLFWIRRRYSANGSTSQSAMYWFAASEVENGAALLYNSNIDLVNATFNNNADAASGEKAHGVEHRTSGTFAYTTWTFDANDADILFSAATGNLTINANAGSNPTTSTVLGTGSVTINTNVTITLTGLIGTPATEVRVYDTGTTTELDGQENVTTGTFAFSLDATDFVDIRIHNVEYEYISIINFDMPAVDTSIPIQQRFDRNYSNP